MTDMKLSFDIREVKIFGDILDLLEKYADTLPVDLVELLNELGEPKKPIKSSVGGDITKHEWTDDAIFEVNETESTECRISLNVGDEEIHIYEEDARAVADYFGCEMVKKEASRKNEILTGDKFIRLCETEPLLAREMAKNAGLTIGELRKRAFEGNVTVGELIDVLDMYKRKPQAEVVINEHILLKTKIAPKHSGTELLYEHHPLAQKEPTTIRVSDSSPGFNEKGIE